MAPQPATPAAADDTDDAALELVRELRASHPTITVLLRSDPVFDAVSGCYLATPGPNCLGVARPRSAAEVAALVRFCATRALPFAVRTGGHDCHARTQRPGALAIDLREICHVRVDEEEEEEEEEVEEEEEEGRGGRRQCTARVGGGCLISGVLEGLERHGLVTPVGTISTVGYVGWAYVGGYGPLSSLYGLGVDQIVGATVVTAAGDIVEADAKLLKGIRGAAGAFGVVVEVTIQVYPLDKVLSGCLIWPTGDDHKTFVKDLLGRLHQLYAEGLPKALNPLFSVWDNLHFTRRVLVMLTWASDDHDEGRRWAAKLAALGGPSSPPAVDTLRPCRLLEGLRANDAFISPRVYGRCHTVTVRAAERTRFVEAITEHTAHFPARGVGMCLHRSVGRGEAHQGMADGGDSVWGPRGEHTMLEIVSTTTEEASAEAAYEWALGLRRAVVSAVPDEVVGGGWLAMTPDEEVDLEKVFGEDYEFLLGLKRKWDPDNVFRNTVPRLPI